MDTLSWHTSDKDYCCALPFPVSFVRESDPYSHKCNEDHEVRTCNFGALEINTWSGDEMNSYNDDRSVTGANSFTNLYAIILT